MIRLGVLRPPELVQLAGQPAGRAYHRALGPDPAVDRAQHLRIRRAIGPVVGRGAIHCLAPSTCKLGDPPPPGIVLRRLELARKLVERAARVALQMQCAVLDPVAPADVDRDQRAGGIREQRRRSGREVLQTRTDRDDEVRLGRELVGSGGAGHANSARVAGVVEAQRALSCLRLGDGDTETLGEAPERLACVGIVDAAAGDQKRPPRFPPQAHGLRDERRVGAVASRLVHTWLEKACRKIGRLRLHVLRQRKRHRSAVGRIGEHGNRLRQRPQELFGPRDPVPVARHRAETIVCAHRAVGEVLDLLQDGVGAAAREYVARQQQHREAVDVRKRGRRHHVGRAGTDRGRAGHQPPAAKCLGVGDRGVRHRLLVVRAQRRKAIAHLRQGLAHSSDVAMTEDGEHPVHERHGSAVDGRLLRHQVAHQRLRGRQSQARHAAARRAACQ